MLSGTEVGSATAPESTCRHDAIVNCLTLPPYRRLQRRVANATRNDWLHCPLQDGSTVAACPIQSSYCPSTATDVVSVISVTVLVPVIFKFLFLDQCNWFKVHYLLLRTLEDRDREFCSSRLSGLSLGTFIKSNRLNRIVWLFRTKVCSSFTVHRLQCDRLSQQQLSFLLQYFDVRWRRSALTSINVVNRHWARLVLWMGDRLRAGKPSRYVTRDLNQLSLPSLQRR